MSTHAGSPQSMPLTFMVAVAMLFSGMTLPAQTDTKEKKDSAQSHDKSGKAKEGTGGESRTRKTVRQHFMEGKMVLSQEILRGVVLQEFDKIEKNAVAMGVLTLAEEWGFSNSKEYLRMSDDLARITRQLAKAAHEKNIHAATIAYQRLTLTCSECHEALIAGLK